MIASKYKHEKYTIDVRDSSVVSYDPQTKVITTTLTKCLNAGISIGGMNALWLWSEKLQYSIPYEKTGESTVGRLFRYCNELVPEAKDVALLILNK